MDIDWNTELLSQLEWHWENHLRPRMGGLTDDEYFWEPVPGCWSVRRRGESAAPLSVGGGDFTMDYAPLPRADEPVTTIAWRLAHLIVGIFGRRNAAHFGGPPADYQTFGYASSAAEALRQLDVGYANWVKGVRSLDADALARPCGPAEAPFGDSPMAGLVLHINREVIHHGAEISLLRDLYLRKDG
jgi:DinB superfamily